MTITALKTFRHAFQNL